MEEQAMNEEILDLQDELIVDSEPAGEDALALEPGVLLLSEELPPEPVIKKIDVGPRVTGSDATDDKSEREIRANLAKAWRVENSVLQNAQPVWQDGRPVPAATILGGRKTGSGARSEEKNAKVQELTRLLSEARNFANEYGAMKARTRKALYEALGRTFDLAVRADEQPVHFARLIEEAGLTAQDRAPYSPVVKLVFGADFDKTRIAEFAAAITYGRRKDLPIGGFTAFLEDFEGGLKAVVGLERLMRKGELDLAVSEIRSEARPAIARRLREIQPAAWGDLSPQGDEFTLLVARRMPDGTMAMVGEVPRDIALLEKAARKLLAELGRTGEDQPDATGYHPEGV